MNDDSVADGDVLDGGADRMHPAGILVSERVGQVDREHRIPAPA